MMNPKIHTKYKFLLVILVTLYVLPLINNFIHEFIHDHHHHCEDQNQVHLHELGADCDFAKFELLKNISFCKINSSILWYEYVETKVFHYYVSPNFIIQSSFLERGPPCT